MMRDTRLLVHLRGTAARWSFRFRSAAAVSVVVTDSANSIAAVNFSWELALVEGRGLSR